jgi:hypothetical protein
MAFVIGENQVKSNSNRILNIYELKSEKTLKVQVDGYVDNTNVFRILFKNLRQHNIDDIAERIEFIK